MTLQYSGRQPASNTCLDTERGQAVFRTRAVAVAALMCLALFAADVITRVPFVLGVLSYLVLAAGWQHWVETLHHKPRGRRTAALVMDQSMIALLAWLGGPECLLFLWTSALASIGHGVRFGPRAGYVSAGLGSVAFAAATLSSPEWRAVPMLSAGLVLMAGLMPTYVVLLVRYLAHARDGAEARAQELERQSRIDPLTGLLNRFGLQVVLDELRTHAPHSPLAIAFVDLDGFKAVNDELGHAAGDQVLCQVADRLRGVVEPDDHVIRLGGDEFVVLHTGLQDTRTLDRLGERLCQAIRLVHPRQRPDLGMRASIGIWGCHARDDLSTILHQADTLMYQSKRSGRDGFVLGSHDNRFTADAQAAA